MTLRIGNSKSSGLTLIELLVAVVIFATVSVIAVQALGMISRALSVAEYRYVAYTFAASKMPQVRAQSLGLNSVPLSEEGSFRSGNQKFEWEVQANPLAMEKAIPYQTMLRISWRQGKKEFENSVSSMIYLPPEEEEES